MQTNTKLLLIAESKRYLFTPAGLLFINKLYFIVVLFILFFKKLYLQINASYCYSLWRKLREKIRQSYIENSNHIILFSNILLTIVI